MNPGTKANASDFNSLFTRLQALKTKHSVGGTAFNTSVAVVGQPTAVSNVQAIKNNLTTLASSQWLNNTFAAKITVPSSGDLLQAANYNAYDNVIKEVEAICAHTYSAYSQSYGQYGANYFNSYDHYS